MGTFLFSNSKYWIKTMKYKMKQIVSILLIVLFFASCQQKHSDNTALVKVKIEGLEEFEYLVKRDASPFSSKIKEGDYKVRLENGELQLEIPNVTEPEYLFFIPTGDEGPFYTIAFFIDKGENTFEGKLAPMKGIPNLKVINKTKLVASAVNQVQTEFDERRAKMHNLFQEYSGKHSQDETEAYINKLQADAKEWELNWVKNHSNEWYAAFMVNYYLSSGADAAKLELLLSYLDPKMDNKQVRNIKARIKEMKNTNIKLEDFIQAKNVRYKVDPSYKGSDFKNVTYMSAIESNKLCELNKEGQFQIIDAHGKSVNTFKPETKSPVTSFAVSLNNDIYALTPNIKTIVKKHRGKEIKKQVVDGVECLVLDAKGKEKKRFAFDGLGAASGAKFLNDQLIVSDCKMGKLYIFDAKSGEKKSEIADMRTCCGILDFCVGADNQLLVADLGAFRVQGYKLNGEKILAFGKRGKEMEEFHGCCNPVNIGRLSNGAIVTVEKSPTRIKIYSQEGARLIEGIEELVKGCAYIPMAIDNVDNLYLASPEKGLVKCVVKV
jgi:hypothetical protein